jgi:hypothetical protein
MPADNLKKELAKAQALAEEAVEWLKSQPLHMAAAFVLAVVFGDNFKAREKALSQDGDPREELWAWNQGLIWRPLLLAWALRQTGNQDVPVVVESLLRDLFDIYPEPSEPDPL